MDLCAWSGREALARTGSALRHRAVVDPLGAVVFYHLRGATYSADSPGQAGSVRSSRQDLPGNSHSPPLPTLTVGWYSPSAISFWARAQYKGVATERATPTNQTADSLLDTD